MWSGTYSWRLERDHTRFHEQRGVLWRPQTGVYVPWYLSGEAGASSRWLNKVKAQSTTTARSISIHAAQGGNQVPERRVTRPPYRPDWKNVTCARLAEPYLPRCDLPESHRPSHPVDARLVSHLGAEQPDLDPTAFEKGCRLLIDNRENEQPHNR